MRRLRQSRFLFARYCADRLCVIDTKSQLSKELRDLQQSSGNRDYAAMYEDIIERIRKQPKPAAELAFRILCWLTMAWRVLSIEELRVAVSVERNQYTLDPDDLRTPERLIEVCAGLAVMDKETNTVRLHHATVREYLLETPDILPPDPNWVLVETCATYLSFDIFKDGACPTENEFLARLSSCPLLHFAAQHIDSHSQIRDEDLSTDTILRFLAHPGSISSYVQVVYSRGRSYFYNTYPKEHYALHVACGIGHAAAVQQLIEGGATMMKGDSHGQFPPHVTVKRGSFFERTLVRKGPDVGAQVSRGCTPLHLATSNGHETIAKLLLDKGVDASVRGRYGRTPRWMQPSATIAKLPLENDVDISMRDSYGSTPLHLAASNGHEAIAKLLLKKGVYASVQNSNGSTPLHFAAFNGHEVIAKLLLDQGADASVDNNDGSTPLHLAALRGHEAIAKLLLDKGVDASVQDAYGYTPLHLAASCRHKGITKLLLKKGVDASAEE
jgi:ankyrin repeat protein